MTGSGLQKGSWIEDFEIGRCPVWCGGFGFRACGGDDATGGSVAPAATETQAPVASTPIPTADVSSSVPATPSSTAIPVASPTDTPVPKPTNTPRPTDTPKPRPTDTPFPTPTPSPTRDPGAVLIPLPSGTRAWEVIPGVIRDDGRDSFVLEVDVNGPVAGVSLEDISSSLTYHRGSSVKFSDDGSGEDRIAGDFIFTSGRFTVDSSSAPESFNLYSDPDSPEGLRFELVGRLFVKELDGTLGKFGGDPEVGVLSSDIPDALTVVLSQDVVVSSHLINLQTNTRDTQRSIRNISEAPLGRAKSPYSGGNPRFFDQPDL